MKKINELDRDELLNLNENSNFTFKLTGAPVMDRYNHIFICVENDNIYIHWKGKEINKRDFQIANNVRSIVLKYKNEINKFAREERRVRYDGGGYRITLIVENIKYVIREGTDDDNKKIFYNNLKKEIYSYVKTLVDNNKEGIEIKTEK